LQTVAAGCRARGAEVAYEVVDVTDAAGMDRWLRTRDTACGVDLLIANAGIGGIGAIAPDNGEAGDLARQIIEINVIGVLNTVTPLLPRLVGRRRGHVAIVSSLAGFLGLPAAPSYCASKAAVRIYAEALRRRLAPHGVRVTAISPGFVDTPMSATLPFIQPWLTRHPRRICWPIDKTLFSSGSLPGLTPQFGWAELQHPDLVWSRGTQALARPRVAGLAGNSDSKSRIERFIKWLIA
jgi:NAD(P)-dependent dehydrogenase (short-subunit alcohol dehydrogenase family)